MATFIGSHLQQKALQKGDLIKLTLFTDSSMKMFRFSTGNLGDEEKSDYYHSETTVLIPAKVPSFISSV